MEKQMCLPKNSLARHQLTLDGNYYPSSILTPLKKPRIMHKQFSGKRDSPQNCLFAASLTKKRSDFALQRSRFFFSGKKYLGKIHHQSIDAPTNNDLCTAVIYICCGQRLSAELNDLSTNSNRT